MPLSKATITRLRSLQEKKQREASGLFVVEGAKVINELLAGGTRFEEVFATEAWQKPVHGSVATIDVSPEDMARISHYPTPSPVLAVGRIKPETLARGELETGLTLALDGIQDPGNVGTLLRIADWFGLSRVLLGLDCADLFSQKVINASMGSFARMRTLRVPLASALSDCGVPIIGCDLAGGSLYDLPPLSDAVVVIGSEGRGLSPEVAARVTRQVTIPRIGGGESLNAGVAAGIVCAELRRGRR